MQASTLASMLLLLLSKLAILALVAAPKPSVGAAITSSSIKLCNYNLNRILLVA
jgi:hypothetical protein